MAKYGEGRACGVFQIEEAQRRIGRAGPAHCVRTLAAGVHVHGAVAHPPTAIEDYAVFSRFSPADARGLESIDCYLDRIRDLVGHRLHIRRIFTDTQCSPHCRPAMRMRSADEQVTGWDAARLRYPPLYRIGNAPGHANKVAYHHADASRAVLQHQGFGEDFVMDISGLPLRKAAAKRNVKPRSQVGSCRTGAQLSFHRS